MASVNKSQNKRKQSNNGRPKTAYPMLSKPTSYRELYGLSKPTTKKAYTEKATCPGLSKSVTKKAIKSSAEKPYPTQCTNTVSTHKICAEKHDPMHKINAECNRIRAVCNKNDKLKTLQLKLAIFEKKTFKKIKYDSKCAHTNCNEKAPKDFPSSDLYICTKHSRQAGFDCQEKLRSLHKLREGSCSHTTETDEKMNHKYSPLDAVMRIPDNFIESLKDGSINKKVKYPKYYWSLFMTKLLMRFRYEKSLGHRKNPERIRLINNMLKLLVVFRYFMNPIGCELLELIPLLMPFLNHMDEIGIVLQALNEMILTILNSVIAMYAVAFIGGLAVVLGLVNDPTSIPQLIACLVAGTALVSAGGFLCVATLGTGVPFSAPLFGSGFGFLVKACNYADNGNNNNNQGNGNDDDDGDEEYNEGNAADAVDRLAQQNVDVMEQLNRIDDLNELQQILDDLEEDSDDN